ncbi:DUF1573 domain-containing protein [Soonwooa sp.]|uniref:DUF1573 domain-containing protein n=1 Tax=Soonwooa sp. TaxID=1938592 RepID=UPI0035B2BF91
MKKTLLGMVAVLGFGLASAQSISFDKTVFDYGKVSAGSDGHRYFTVKNTGDKPLILTEVKPACGCTTPEWSKDPILPGKSAQIKVGYNTNLIGAFSKPIEVFSNDPKNPRSVLTIKGEVGATAAQQVQTLQATPATMKAEVVRDAVPAQSKKTARAQKIQNAAPVRMEEVKK